ncbi:MAG: hypothetical protein NTAFB09_09340 [Nitrosospira sp.]
MFNAPFENLSLRDAVDFYKHERGWANRLVAVDLLLQKEGVAGQVQMIYIDPLHGICRSTPQKTARRRLNRG